MSWWKILLLVGGGLVVAGIGIAWYLLSYAELDIYVPLYADNCAQCHGAQLQGSDQGPALVGLPLRAGDTVQQLQQSIKNAHLQLGGPGFVDSLNDVQIKGLAIFVGERRLGQRFTDFRFDRDVHIPAEVQVSEQHGFRVQTVAQGLDPLVFSIAPLPDGSLLLTEKERGLSIISADGEQSAPITGTPTLGGSVDIMGIQYGSGWLLDVALHPNYEENGWIYLHYTHLCGDLCDSALVQASMNRLDRGRIVDGHWTDVQTIWQAPLAFYQSTPDTGAGGRIAFDNDGHVFISVGIKSSDGLQDVTSQDLAQPYGKIHRVNDDGTIPIDNPLVSLGTVSNSVWTYGHRSPQGLEWNPVRKTVWNSEMGPRGGDELNELLPGRNYGWPYHSQGLEYLGSTVERHKPKSIEFDASDVELSLVDITPSPAISSFAFYSGNAFPGWQGNVLIGSLKGSSLFRMVKAS